MTKHKLKDTIGAFINVEASGTGGIGKIYSLKTIFTYDKVLSRPVSSSR